MTVVLEDLDTVLSIDDELVEHDCPLHEDLVVGDLSKITDPHRRRWLEIACSDIAFHEAAARHAQVELQDDVDPAKRYELRRKLRLTRDRAARIREDLRRVIAGEPEPDRGPYIDLWAND